MDSIKASIDKEKLTIFSNSKGDGRPAPDADALLGLQWLDESQFLDVVEILDGTEAEPAVVLPSDAVDLTAAVQGDGVVLGTCDLLPIECRVEHFGDFGE